MRSATALRGSGWVRKRLRRDGKLLVVQGGIGWWESAMVPSHPLPLCWRCSVMCILERWSPPMSDLSDVADRIRRTEEQDKRITTSNRGFSCIQKPEDIVDSLIHPCNSADSPE